MTRFMRFQCFIFYVLCRALNNKDSRFTAAALPALLKEIGSLPTECIPDLLKLNKDVLAISDVDLTKEIWKKEKDRKFDDVLSANTVTKDQLLKMRAQFPGIESNGRFQRMMMEKSMPISVSFYLGRIQRGESFQDFLPRALAMRCYDVILDLVMDQTVEWPIASRSVVLLDGMRFRVHHFVCHSALSSLP